MYNVLQSLHLGWLFMAKRPRGRAAQSGQTPADSESKPLDSWVGLTAAELAADKRHKAEYQDPGSPKAHLNWHIIIRDVSLKTALKAANKFRDQNPGVETRVR